MLPRAAVCVLACLSVGACGDGGRTVTVTRTVTVEEGAATATSSPAPGGTASTASVGTVQTYENVDRITIDDKSVDTTLEVRVSRLDPRVPNPQYLEPQQGSRYVRMSVAIRNVGKDSYAPSAEFQVLTKDGSSANFQSLGQPGDLGPAAVRPGKTIKGFVWAEIPQGERVDEIVFAPFGGDPEVDLVWAAQPRPRR